MRINKVSGIPKERKKKVSIRFLQGLQRGKVLNGIWNRRELVVCKVSLLESKKTTTTTQQQQQVERRK
jgi:hypothetical protein